MDNACNARSPTLLNGVWGYIMLQLCEGSTYDGFYFTWVPCRNPCFFFAVRSLLLLGCSKTSQADG